MEDIHSTDGLIAVNPTLSSRFVNFVSYPVLNDIISEGLLKRIPMTRLWSVDTLKGFDIMNCPGISVGALKESAQSRIVEATER